MEPRTDMFVPRNVFSCCGLLAFYCHLKHLIDWPIDLVKAAENILDYYSRLDRISHNDILKL